ncbi:MAG: 3-dehydroquinate synthase [Caldimonas sp.]
MRRRIVRVALPSNAYDIVVGRGLLDDPEVYAVGDASATAVLVTNETLAPLFADRVGRALRAAGRPVLVSVLPDGEGHKDWPSVQAVLDSMVGAHCDRDTTVYALGGGVVGDTAGFAAACYMRGVGYVQIPTTLLAQVDSSVGGKTGINHAHGKNLIGAFHQPRRVLTDLDTLDSLPQRELVAGLAEVIKHGAACDADFLGWIEERMPALIGRDKEALAQAVWRSCEIKARIVATDEREAGLRATLNFGHTFAHAIETGLGYGTWLHGEAVGCGMVLACDLSARLGLIGGPLAERIRRIVASAGLPVEPPDIGIERYLELMRLDKKSRGGEMRFILLEGAGRAVVRPVDPARVAETLAAAMAPRP